MRISNGKPPDGRKQGGSRFFAHPPLDRPRLTRLFEEWLDAAEHDQHELGARALRDLQQGGIFGLHLQRRGGPHHGQNPAIPGANACNRHRNNR
jgi:hypothetical protein